MKNTWAQGVGRHSKDEILAFAKEDLNALSVILGNQSFFMGDKPTSIDATIYGFLAQLIYVPWLGPLLTNLVDYAERMKARYWV